MNAQHDQLIKTEQEKYIGENVSMPLEVLETKLSDERIKQCK